MSAHRGGRRRAVTVLAMLVATSGAVGLPGAAPASAGTTNPCPSDLYEGDDLRTVACYSWRGTYVFDAGRHHYTTRDDIARHQSVYTWFGFPENFTWFAEETYRTFRRGPDSGVKWANCQGTSSDGFPSHELDWDRNGSGRRTGLCTDRIVRAEDQATSLLDAFESDVVTLRVLQHRESFIALECGNFSARPSALPVPTLSGVKFHDGNRNGLRDDDEAGMGGWEMRLIRDSSLVGQPTGDTGVRVTTAADGTYSLRLWEQGPGNYHVEEVQKDGFVQTRAPGSVHVPFGAGSRDYAGNDFGNVEDTADVVKVDWTVVSPPPRIEAGVPTTLSVRATLTNTGPAPEVDVADTMTARGQDDCHFVPQQQTVTRRLRRGEPVHVDFSVTVTCEDPSNHLFVFDNALRITSNGVTDPDLSDNARVTSVTIPVFDDSDLSLSDAALDCPARADVTHTFTCTGSAVLRNDGPYGATNADVRFAITPPSDCAVTAGPSRRVDDTAVAAGAAVAVSVVWDISCAARSYHPIEMSAVAAVDHEHVEDHVSANDTATASDTVEVFESADLSIVRPVRIACEGRLPSITSFPCDVRVTVENAGPATAVLTATTASLTAPSDCMVAPASITIPTTLDRGERETLTFHYDLTCTTRVLHTVLASAAIAADEPHAEDRALANNTGRARWVPTDVKPRSEPSSVNVAKEGVVPVAILSTPEFDAFATVDRTTLRWGVTGSEPSLVSCGGETEDTNGDGFGDLVCRFDTRLAGLTCATRTAVLTGALKDGTRIESQDPVNVTGCKK